MTLSLTGVRSSRAHARRALLLEHKHVCTVLVNQNILYHALRNKTPRLWTALNCSYVTEDKLLYLTCAIYTSTFVNLTCEVEDFSRC